MTAESPIRMLDNDRSFHASPFNNIVLHEGFTEVLKDSCVLEEPARVVPDRSGSAPPTIEGSISAFRTFMYHRHSTMGNNEFSDCESEEQIRTNPGYISYYYANVNLNPRLPPPLLSRENRHLVRLMGYLGSKKSTSVNDALLASHREEEPEEDISLVQSMGDQIGQIVSEKVSSLTVDNRGSIDLKKEGVIQTPSPTSGRAIKEENGHDIHTVSTNQVSETQESCSGGNEVDYIQQTVKATSACHRSADIDDNMSTQSNMGSDYSAVESRMKSLNVSGTSGADDKQKRHDNVQLHDTSRISSHPLQNKPIPFPGIHVHALPELPGMQPLMPNSGLAPPLYAATAAYMNSGNHYYPSLPPTSFPHPQFSVSGFIGNPVFHAPNPGGYLQGNAFPMSIDAYSTPGSVKQPIEVTRGIHPYPGHMMLRPSYNEPLPGQFQHQPFGNVWRSATPHGQLTRRDGVDGQFDIHAAQKCTDRAYSISIPPNAGPLRVNFYGPPSLNLPNFSVPSPALVPGSPMARTSHSVPENDTEIPQHSPKNAVPIYWEKGQRSDNSDDSKRHSFLELLKSSSSRKLELADISGQIAELSTDQHGSRFIQQKLEHCGVDEKETVFGEILPHASKLMIDVFGNYVIQKFFEHGTTEHRRKLGQQLSGQIVTLSLQMYGCRVIQKALEVIEIDQKVELVKELDGHVMKCVHDQNGNHVIQKCIESIPAERIGFIISSFYGQVASLSSHPYGCRVIQRILEHCSDEKLSQCIVDEILEAACTLAQDPYGNYVTQHMLEKGKPQERSQIICKLTGKFVHMSQHKYASNVVEKCLKYGGASEQNLVIEEIFAQPNNNDALLMMIKGQFANYVIQRIFDVGNDKQRNILLNCIRIHLPVLKRFPYAKHLVARYEQLSEGSTKEQK